MTDRSLVFCRRAAGAPGAMLRFECALGLAGGAHVLRLEGLRFDNHLLPRGWNVRSDWTFVAHVARGTLVVDGRALVEKATFLVPAGWVIAPGPPPAHVRSASDALELVAIRVPTSMVRGRSEELVLVDGAMATGFDALETSLATRTTVSEAIAAVLDPLVDEGLLDPAARSAWTDPVEIPAHVRHAAETVLAALEELPVRPGLVDLIERAGRSERTVLRNLSAAQDALDLFDHGWREALGRWKQTTAVFLLSSPELSLETVAELSGFGTRRAMTDAFAHARLRPPTVIREMLLRDRDGRPVGDRAREPDP